MILTMEFTKALREQCLKEAGKNLKLGDERPSDAELLLMQVIKIDYDLLLFRRSTDKFPAPQVLDNTSKEGIDGGVSFDVVLHPQYQMNAGLFYNSFTEVLEYHINNELGWCKETSQEPPPFKAEFVSEDHKFKF